MGLKALLVGINAYQQLPLRGCVNDVHRMRDLCSTYTDWTSAISVS
ncbi:MAG: caspase family protein [Chloroflexaceae bacterium]|nr:caspase family protein [Chloroflexaceae bacterium]